MFMDSRLEAGKGGTGAGLLYRFLSIWGIIAFMLSLYTINLRKKTLIFYLSCGFIIFYILTLFLGGSKAALLTVANLLFIYAILFSTPSYNLLAQLKKHEKTIIDALVVWRKFRLRTAACRLCQSIYRDQQFRNYEPRSCLSPRNDECDAF